MTVRALRKVARKASFRAFLCLDRVGLHVLPKHYYNPVADYTWLAKNRALWAHRTELSGVTWDLDRQLSWLEETCGRYYGEVRGLQMYKEITKTACGQGYGPIESQVLHCFIRSQRPARILEFGGGISSACALNAIRKNARENLAGTKLVCVEPFPRPALAEMREIHLIPQRAQEQDLSLFDWLQAGDLLFIDSSHAVKTGSDVLFLYLEAIPRLKPGVFIHIHDIGLPYVYRRDTFSHFHAWQETSLLLALLKGNSHLKVLCCMSALHYDARAGMGRILTDYRPQTEIEEGLAEPDCAGHFPSSIWLVTA